MKDLVPMLLAYGLLAFSAVRWIALARAIRQGRGSRPEYLTKALEAGAFMLIVRLLAAWDAVVSPLVWVLPVAAGAWCVFELLSRWDALPAGSGWSTALRAKAGIYALILSALAALFIWQVWIW